MWIKKWLLLEAITVLDIDRTELSYRSLCLHNPLFFTGIVGMKFSHLSCK